MRLEDVTNTIQNFANFSHAEKIRFFAWYTHTMLGKDRFSPSDIRSCYENLTLEQPKNVTPYLIEMFNRKPRVVLRDGRGYALERRVRDQLSEKYGQRQATVLADRLLQELPLKLPALAERVFLEETVKCFRSGAFRATIVMAWNLAYDHFCKYLFKEPTRLKIFNDQLPKSFPRAQISHVEKIDDFGELKESAVIQTARSANLISNDLFKVLKEKLDKRNSAAHPSSIDIAPHTAEEFVIDLVNNAVLKLG